MLSKEAILAAADLQTTELTVEEWGGVVRISTLSGAARDALQGKLAEDKSPAAFQAALVVATVVDDAGAPLFTEADIPALRGKSAAVLDKVAAAAIEWNKMGPQATDEAVKNSDGDQNADSGSASV